MEEVKTRGPAYSAATVNNKFGKSISGYSHSTGTKFNFNNKKISSP